MLDALQFALSHIEYLVNTLSKKTYKQSCAELCQLVNQHGFEAERHLYRCLFSCIDFSGVSHDGRNSRDFYQTQFLIQEINSLFAKPYFVTIICYAVSHPFASQKSLRPSSSLLGQISRVLKLNRVQEVTLGLSLLSSLRQEMRELAKQWLRLKLCELLKSYVDADAGGAHEGGGLHDVSIEIVHLILAKLREDKTQFGISDDLVESFLRVLRKDFPKQRVPVVLGPLLYPDSEDMQVSKTFRESSSLQQMVVNSTVAYQSTQQGDNSLAGLLEEIGYGCTETLEKARNTLAEFGAMDATPAAVARCISMFMRTCEVWHDVSTLNGADRGSNDRADAKSWNVDNFLTGVYELNPGLQMRSILPELDHPGFEVKSPRALQLLRSCLNKNSLGHSKDITIEVFYQPWKNPSGQLSLLKWCVAQPDILCLSNWQCRQANVGCLKHQPDEMSLKMWRNLDLIEALLTLSEQGLYSEVREIFDNPARSCPDLLLLSLLQTQETNGGILKQELVQSLVLTLLSGQANSVPTLNFAWSCSVARPIILHCLTDFFVEGEEKGDQSRVGRILETISNAFDGMATLTQVLKSRNHVFSLSLACLAARRDFLNLEMWLNDSLQKYGNQLAEVTLKFLVSRSPKLFSSEDVRLHEAITASQLEPQIIQTILHCLDRQRKANRLSSELSNELVTLTRNFTQHFSKLPVRQQNSPGAPSPASNEQQPVSLTSQTQSVAMPIPNQQPSFVNQFGKPLPPHSVASASVVSLGSSAASNQLLPTGIQTIASHMPRMSPAIPMIKQGLGNPLSGITPKHTIAGPGMGLPHPPPPPPQPTSQSLVTGTPRFASGLPIPAELSATSVSGGNDLDERVSLIMKSLFSGAISSDEVFGMLKEKSLCNYFLRVLAEEFIHIPTDFPLKEKGIMAELFGRVIALGFQLTTHSVLAYFLRLLNFCVTRPLEAEADHAFFSFGVDILNKCKGSLSSYKQVASHLLGCDNFAKFPKDLQIAIQIAANGSTVPKETSNTSMAGAVDQGGEGKADGDEAEHPPVPSESVQDTVYFIFNNLSKSNLKVKAADLRKALGDEHIVWLGQHIVMKRVTTEPNFHQLFVDLIDALEVPRLREIVLEQTFRGIRTLLQNMRPDLNDYNDRALLKNIGRFLGLLTIAKNRPILYDDMDLKGLLLEAYCKGQVEMHYAVPFVARTLEACAASEAFRPPNPWTMGILRVLKELHMDKAVKNSLKFEVEILCKKLNISFDEIEPAYYLRDSERVRQIEVENCQICSGQSKPSESGIRVGMSGPVEEFEPSQPPVTIAATAPPPTTSTASPSLTLSPVQPVSASAAPQVAFPHYKWTDVDTGRPISSYFVVNQSLTLLQAHPVLSRDVPRTLEATVNELLEPVAQRCVRIVLATVEGIVRKDFALDDDERRLRTAAHNMARFLTAGMALITCREALSINMETKLKQLFLHALHSPTAQEKEMINDAVKLITVDNLEIGTAIIQKSCVEKALAQVDANLEGEFRVRIQAKQEGRRYFDTVQYAHQKETMPPHLRKPLGPAAMYSLAVYSEYAASIPGFVNAPPQQPPQHQSVHQQNNQNHQQSQLSQLNNQQSQHNQHLPPQAPAAVTPPASSVGLRSEVSQLFDNIIAEVQRQSQYINSLPNSNGDSGQLAQRLGVLVERAQLAKQTGQDSCAGDVIKTTILSLFQTFKRQSLSHYPQEVLERYKDAHTCILRLMYQPKISSFGYSSCMSHVVTQIWTEMSETIKWNSDAFVELLKIHIVSLQALDSHLAKLIRVSNPHALSFVMDLFVKLILSDSREQTVLNECDLTGTISVLSHWIDKSPAGHVPDECVRVNQQVRALLDFGLLEAYQQPATTYLYSGCSQAREFDDPPWLQETSEGLMKKWSALYSSQRVVDQRNFSAFVKEMTQLGILKTDDLITRFFRLTTNYVMEHCFRALLKSGHELIANRVSCYQECDAYIRLIAIMVKYSGEQGPESRESTASTKINLLNKILGIIVGTLLQEQDIRSDRFHPMPFQRIFVMLFSELLCPSEADGTGGSLAAMATPVLAAFANALHIVRPAKAPAFTYSWVECISHRVVLSKFLGSSSSWPMFAQLLVDLLKFLSPFLASASFTKTVRLLYKGTLRVILILLHDFPDFVSEYHHVFCDVIPLNCIQLRNLVLSAFPKVVQLLDPIQTAASVCYSLPEMQAEPKGSYAGMESNIPVKLREEVDNFLSTRKPVTFLTDLQNRIRIPGEMGKRYDVELTNALVLYVGRHAVKRINETGNSLQAYNMTHCVETETLQALVMLCCTEGRYLLLNAMANQLRYPNSHTFYFNQILLFFFRESNNEQIKEQITRVLLERLIVNRPHPWGLLLTFTELLKNPVYNFWDHEFVRCSPSIEKLLESVARSCVPGFRMPPIQQPLTADSLMRTTVTTLSNSLSNGPPPVTAVNSL